MSVLLIVDHVPSTFSEEKVGDLFRQYGKVLSVRIVRDQHRHSLGFGFVKMHHLHEAQRAVEGLNGKEVSGRTVTVSISTPSTT